MAWTAWLSSTPPSSVAHLPAPGDGVVVRPPAPGDLDRRRVRRPGDASVDEGLHLLEAVAEPVLEDRHEPPGAGRLGLGEGVAVAQRRDERLLAHDVLAGRQGRGDLLEVERRRRAEVDDVDVVALRWPPRR